MDKSRILQRGEEAKFFVEIKDFDMDDFEFKVELIFGYRQKVLTIEKSQMQKSTKDRWYFVFDTSEMVGKVVARCVWRVQDGDYPDNYREEVDEQVLCFVASTPYPKLALCPMASVDRQVVYDRTEKSSLADYYQVLVDKDRRRIVTADDELVLVLKESEDETEARS